jgi:hypothetical protein
MGSIVSRYIGDSMRVLILLAAALPVVGQLPTCSAPMWSPCDLVFELQAGEDAARAELRGDFRSPHKDTKTIRAFREGNALVLRFTPDEVGEWDYRLTSTLKRLDAQIGKTAGTASDAPGFVRTANVHHFQTANLQPHLWMGSAIENFVSMPRAEFEAAVAARAAEKFNHLRVTIEPATDLKEAAERIRVIHNRGLVTDLVFASIPDDRRERERYVTEMAARFSAFNLVWAGVPAFERVKSARTVLRDTADLLTSLDPYKHVRTAMSEATSSPLLIDKWMTVLSYGTPDPNVGAVEHQLTKLPAINAGIKTRADLWNATMNGHYPSSGSGREFAVWFDVMAKTRYWEMEPYFEVSGGRAIAVREGVGVYGDEEESVEYLVYVEKPGPVEVPVEDHGYDVAWINPSTGERIPAKGYKGKSFAGEPPDKERDWLLHISREGKKAGLNKYKFESRRIIMQQPETNPNSLPFEMDSPSGDISMRAPSFYSLKILRGTRATRNLLIVWTAEMTTGAEGGRVVGVGKEGTLRMPASFADKLPGLVTLRASVLNANGKVYVIDHAFKLVP